MCIGGTPGTIEPFYFLIVNQMGIFLRDFFLEIRGSRLFWEG